MAMARPRVANLSSEHLERVLQDQKRKHLVEYISSVNYLHTLGKLTADEVKSLHEMMKSPDSGNVEIAEDIVKRKLDEIGLADLNVT